MMTLDNVREIGATLPDVAVSAGKLGVALKTKGEILACQAIHRSAEPGSLMVRVGTQRRDALVAEDPEVFYLTSHYEPYPVVLVRLSRIDRAWLGGLLTEALEFTGNETG